ncbi:MAG TPA: transglycosylase domain-containing protein [Burkholderiales bacterium]|nr:transglycosylase domain-containing protein [Burkholderiales bacterium]
MLGLAALVVYTLLLIPLTPSVGDAAKGKAERPTMLISVDGKPLAAYRRLNRKWVGLDHISPHVAKALVATEDHRFYEHHGIDIRRTASSVFWTLTGDPQGGSTISQQLARNLFPEEIGRSSTVSRKLKEMIVAVKLEQRYEKREILELYLNTVPFLYNAYGTEMASMTYFDKPASKLNLVESATLIGMLKGTYYYNPKLHPERAVARRNVVLAQMLKHGAINKATYEAARKQPLKLDFQPQKEWQGSAPHLANHLKNWLIDWADKNDYDIYTDGLRVHTTLDSRLQDYANQAVERQAAALQAVADVEWGAKSAKFLSGSTQPYQELAKRVAPFKHFWTSKAELVDAFIAETPEYRKLLDDGNSADEALNILRADEILMNRLREEKTRLQAGFVAIDPRSGAVRAWVGSRDFRTDPFDHVNSASRQPGSTFKPFVYGAALQKGMSPNQVFQDVKVEMRLANGTVWEPGDSKAPTGGEVPMRDGLIYSKNNITAQVMHQTGPDPVANLAHQAGIRQSKLDAVPSLALGTSAVTLLEMVSSYSTIAALGEYHTPWMVRRITDRNGNVLAEFNQSQSEPVIDEQTTVQLIDMLRAAVDEGTGQGIRTRFNIDADVAGKTGTTQDNMDGWFILMHPQLVGGAWMGFNDPRVRMRSNYWGQGAHNALLIVGDFYKRALQGRAIDESARFPNPPEQSWFGGFFDRFGKQLRQWGGDEREEPAPIEDRTPRRAPPPEENYEQQIRREAAEELEAQKEIERELQRMGR